MDTNINSIDTTYESSTVEYDDSNIAAIENELIEIANLFNSIDAEMKLTVLIFLTISKILKQQFTVLRGFSLQFLHQQ